MLNELSYITVINNNWVLLVSAAAAAACVLVMKYPLESYMFRGMRRRNDNSNSNNKASAEADWDILVKASQGILGSHDNDRRLLQQSQGHGHLLDGIGRIIYFCVAFRDHASTTTVVSELIEHLETEHWRKLGDGLLETILEYMFHSSSEDDVDNYLMKRCLMAMTTSQLHASVIPQTVCDLVVRCVIREELQRMRRTVNSSNTDNDDDDDDLFWEQITLATTNRIKSMIEFLGLADGKALLHACWEGGDSTTGLDWKDHVVQALTIVYQNPEEHTDDELICACTMLPSFLVQIRQYLQAESLLQDAVFCRQRSLILGSATGTKRHLDDLKLLNTLSHQALVKLQPTVEENIVLAFSVHIQKNGVCLYALGCFLLDSQKNLAAFEVLENARRVYHQHLEGPLKLVADALEHLGALYLVHKEDSMKSRYESTARMLRRDPTVNHLYLALILYCKHPIHSEAGFITRLERLLLRFQNVQEILASLLLTLQTMSKLPADPAISNEESIVATCLELIDGIRVPQLPRGHCRLSWWFAPTLFQS